MTEVTGVLIASGAVDWQIFQQSAQGTADIQLRGTWISDIEDVVIYCRVVDEAQGCAISSACDWHPVQRQSDAKKTWETKLSRVPAGGLYRIETKGVPKGQSFEWGFRGDMVHHLGVGDLWLLAGQSNSAGYGKSPAADGPELGVHQFQSKGTWSLGSHPLNDSTATLFPAHREEANPSHSPYLAFAKQLKAKLGYPIGLIPTALGGSPMRAWDPEGEGYLFNNAVDMLKAAGCKKIKGVLWYQGESDTNPDAIKKYPKSFANMVEGFRARLKQKALPIITVQLNRYIGVDVDEQAWNAWEQMRETQRQIAEKSDHVEIISSLGLHLSDGIHNDSSSNLILAQRFAQTALGAIYRQAVDYRFPSARTAILKKKVEVHLEFDNISGQLHYECHVAQQLPFVVRDSSGIVPIASWRIERENGFVLVLERSPMGKTMVVGGATHSPSDVIPVDLKGYRPMLGFICMLRRR